MDSEGAAGWPCVVELQRTQAERAGVDLWLRRSIGPGGLVTSPNREMSQSIRLLKNYAGEPTVEPDKVFPFVSSGRDFSLTSLVQTHECFYRPPEKGRKTV